MGESDQAQSESLLHEVLRKQSVGDLGVAEARAWLIALRPAMGEDNPFRIRKP